MWGKGPPILWQGPMKVKTVEYYWNMCMSWRSRSDQVLLWVFNTIDRFLKGALWITPEGLYIKWHFNTNLFFSILYVFSSSLHSSVGGNGTSRLGLGVGGGGRISLMESPRLRDFEEDVEEECDDSFGTRGSQPALVRSSGDMSSRWAKKGKDMPIRDRVNKGSYIW